MLEVMDTSFPTETYPAQTLVIVISPQAIQLAEGGRLFSHELLHALQYSFLAGQPAWLREGMATYFESMILEKYNPQLVQAALELPEISFFQEYDLEASNFELYGTHFLYFNYLISHCGNESLFWDLLQNPEQRLGVDLISSTLKTREQENPKVCDNFFSSLSYFTVAKIHNKMSFKDILLPDQSFNLNMDQITSTRATPLELQNQVLKSHWPAFTPLVFDYALGLPLNLVKNQKFLYAKKYWVQKSFPFAVIETAPVEKKMDFWLVIHSL